MNSIVEQLKSVLSPEIRDTVAQAIDEPKEKVTRALDALFSVLIIGIIQKEEEDTDSGVIEHLTSLLKEQALWDGGSITTDYVGIRNILLGEGEQAHKSTRFITLVFNDKIKALTSNIANYAEIKIGSAYSLTILAGTFVIAILTKHAFDNNFLPTALLRSLRAQKDHVLATAPSSLLTVLGLNKYQTVMGKTKGITTDIQKNNIFKIIILILALLIIAFLLLHSCSSSNTHNQTATSHSKTTTKKSWAKLGGIQSVKLPDGSKIEVPEHGVENRLLAFIANPQKSATHSPLFSFDRLLFNKNSAVLSSKSNAQLESIAQILKSFPKVHILIGGFTDDTGTAKINHSLSKERAKNVKNHLVKLGISARRIKTKGFSDAYPVGSNKTSQGRAENRRAGILVTKK